MNSGRYPALFACLLCLCAFAATTYSAEDAVKPPRPPDDLDSTPTHPEKKKVTIDDIKASLRSGDRENTELFLNICFASVRWPDCVKDNTKISYAKVNTEHVCVVKMQVEKAPSKDIHSVCVKAAIQIGELKELGSPIQRAEIHMNTGKTIGIYTIPIPLAQKLAREKEQLGDFTYATFEKFIKGSDFDGIQELIAR